MNVIVFRATGMVGAGMRTECLATLVGLAAISGRDASTLSHGLAALEAMAAREPAVKQWLGKLSNACMQA